MHRIDTAQEIAKLLLQHGANVNAADEDGETPLHCAVLHGQVAMVNLLLRQFDLDPDAVTNQDQTALHLTVKRGEVECFKALLMSDADRVCFDADGCTPCDLALKYGQLYMLKLLRVMGASFGNPPDCGRVVIISRVELTLIRNVNFNYTDRHVYRSDPAVYPEDTPVSRHDTAPIPDRYRERNPNNSHTPSDVSPLSPSSNNAGVMNTNN